jgi:hypothetical protein
VAFLVPVEPSHRLADFAEYAHLVGAVEALRREARATRSTLQGRTIWMVN